MSYNNCVTTVNSVSLDKYFNCNFHNHYLKCHILQVAVGAVSAVARWVRGIVFDPCWTHFFFGKKYFLPWNGLGRDHCQPFLYDRGLRKRRYCFLFPRPWTRYYRKYIFNFFQNIYILMTIPKYIFIKKSENISERVYPWRCIRLRHSGTLAATPCNRVRTTIVDFELVWQTTKR